VAERSPPITRSRRLWPLRASGQPCDASRPVAQDGGTQTLPPLLLTDPVGPAGAPAGAPGTSTDATAPDADDGIPYLSHFGLSRRPFSLLPDPDFLFWSPSHKRAHAVLEYGLMSRAPLTMGTGAIGAGKTTLVHQLLRGLGRDVRVGLISNASDLRGELLYWVLSALGQSPERGADPAAVFEAFQKTLIDTYAEGRRVVLIFDEAQTLGRDRLEELRMLTNINTGSDVLLQIVLVGQPDLHDTVRRPDMEQFIQRVAASFHLPAMTAEIQAQYIDHRVRVAGADRRVFAPAALAGIHAATGGVPRLTNQICDLAMLYAYSADKPVVDAACVQHVLDDGVLPGAWSPPDAQPAVPHDSHGT
jgi:type II secretory pathway predicted ATPase ExeA